MKWTIAGLLLLALLCSAQTTGENVNLYEIGHIGHVQLWRMKSEGCEIFLATDASEWDNRTSNPVLVLGRGCK